MRALVVVVLVAGTAAADPLADGAAALEAGRLDEAIARFEEAVATRGPAAWFDLCLARYAAGDYGRAIDACYRALPAHSTRAVMVLERIKRALPRGSRAAIPEPTLRWANPEPAIGGALAATVPADPGTRRAGPARPALGSYDVLGDAAGALAGPPPALPYGIAGRADDYLAGQDLELRAGALFYAPDTTPFVIGVRGSARRRGHGDRAHLYQWGEYLQALDGGGGIAAGGVGGGPDTGSGAELGLAIPWGRDARRTRAMFSGHDVGLHAGLRLWVRRELVVGALAVSFQASISGGFDVAKGLSRLGAQLRDICLDDHSDEGGEGCAQRPDPDPLWKLTHWMLDIGVGIGRRTGVPRYAHPEVFEPIGAR